MTITLGRLCVFFRKRIGSMRGMADRIDIDRETEKGGGKDWINCVLLYAIQMHRRLKNMFKFAAMSA